MANGLLRLEDVKETATGNVDEGTEDDTDAIEDDDDDDDETTNEHWDCAWMKLLFIVMDAPRAKSPPMIVDSGNSCLFSLDRILTFV